MAVALGSERRDARSFLRCMRSFRWAVQAIQGGARSSPRLVMTSARRATCAPLLALAAVTLLGGCLGPIVGPAPFRLFPGAARYGELLGPFSGQVVDADSGRPVENALIYCAWGFDRGVKDPGPFAELTQMARSGADGTYAISRPQRLPQGLSTRLARFALLIIRPGYISYHHRWAFERSGGTTARYDFTQHGNTVRLARWSGGLSAAEHLVFMGGPQHLRASAALVAAASGSLRDRLGAQRRPPAPTTAALTSIAAQARSLLVEDDVRAVSGFVGPFDALPLGTNHQAQATWHLRARGKGQRYDVALYLWRLAPGLLERQFETLKQGLAGHTAVSGVGSAAFVVTQGEIRALALVQHSSRCVVLLTCGTGQCATNDQLLLLGRKVANRATHLPRLVAAPHQETKP